MKFNVQSKRQSLYEWALSEEIPLFVDQNHFWQNERVINIIRFVQKSYLFLAELISD